MKELIPFVKRPSRYLGNEINAIRKRPEEIKLSWCLIFPDMYEVGMSHLGISILYHLLNSHPLIAAERAFLPDLDMQSLMKERGVLLSSLESDRPLRDFDILGFSLQYELSYTGVLNALDLAGIPFLSSQRNEKFPLIIGGGPCAFNPEPVAEFFDAFVVGDGEEAIMEISFSIMESKKKGLKKREILERLSEINGIYIPSLLVSPGKVIQRRIIPDLEDAFFPESPIVPFCQIIHDRIPIEIARGCTRGCRFCQAGMIYRPLRERSPKRIVEIAKRSIESTGYEELSLLSLSSGDYSSIKTLLSMVAEEAIKRHVAISLPSLRPETISEDMIREILRVRRTGFTLAPEAGTERLRRIINKFMRDEEILNACEKAFSSGWRGVKLYFMIGLPQERDEDLYAIAELCRSIVKRGCRPEDLRVSVANFVPKPHTPFQWLAQENHREFIRKKKLLQYELGRSRITFKGHSIEMSMIEGVLARGDRRLSAVILEAYKKGAIFDSWKEHFKFSTWMDSFKDLGIDPEYYIYRERGRDEEFPWDFIGSGTTKEFLWLEFEKSKNGELTEDCRLNSCSSCGVCDFKNIRNITFEEASKTPSVCYTVSQKTPVTKIRLKFTKCGDMKYLGHLELVSLFNRAARRANLPLKYSEGFHPMPRIIFSPPIPSGIESLSEYVDIELIKKMDAQDVMRLMNSKLPEGIKIMDAQAIPLKTPALQNMITGFVYRIERLQDCCDNCFDALRKGALIFARRQKLIATIERDGRKKDIDLKTEILDINVSNSQIRMTLRFNPRGSLRIDEALSFISGTSVHRHHIGIIKIDTVFSRIIEEDLCPRN